jgi:predicted membrane-bound spermidine synthase
VRYSRRPRMVPFLATGAVLGLLAGIALMVLGPESDSSGAGQELVLLGSTGALLGGLVGAIVFLAVERRHR